MIYLIKPRVAILIFIHQTISILLKSNQDPIDVNDPNNTINITDSMNGLLPPLEISLRLFLDAGLIASNFKKHDLSYEFYVQCFLVFEELPTCLAQTSAITLIMKNLSSNKTISREKFDVLVSKCRISCKRLLKLEQQSRAMLDLARLYWQHEFKEIVLECIQESLKIADSVLDRQTCIELFVLILEQCVWYNEAKNTLVYVYNLDNVWVYNVIN